MVPAGSTGRWRMAWRQAGGGDAAAPVPLALADGRKLRLTCRSLPAGGCLVLVEDRARERASGSEALRLGHVDDLTGLASRVKFGERLEQSLAGLAGAGRSVALLCLDLDRFKAVNDTLGHPLGDALLRLVAERLRSAVRGTDLVARLGGDEFTILQAGVEQPEAATTLARRLVDLVGRAYVIDGHLVNVGLSVGIAVAPQDGCDRDRLLRLADLALCRAKAEGRSTFRLFAPAMDEAMQVRRALEIDLRRALALRELELHYQPLYNLSPGRIAGFEALLRWRHPDRGMVSPADFVPLAEETGLIIPIGDWVLRTACREAARWPSGLSVAVNLSPVQFRGGRLVETVEAALAASGLAAGRLELEITEGVLMVDNEATLGTLRRLRELGVRIVMDDFGTGYSSLSYLRAFPFDKVKIDRSFVRELASDRDSASIVRAIVALGRSLGIATTAEGVETPEQIRQIHAEGCTQVQGFIISRPVPADEVLSLVAAQAA